MTHISLEDLESFRGMSSELAALQKERQWLYYPVASPNGRENIGQRGNQPSDPTASAYYKIEVIDQKIIARQTEIAEKLAEILDWMDTIENREIRAMIHWRYLIGEDWKMVCRKVYGYDSPDACRKRVALFFGREK